MAGKRPILHPTKQENTNEVPQMELSSQSPSFSSSTTLLTGPWRGGGTAESAFAHSGSATSSPAGDSVEEKQSVVRSPLLHPPCGGERRRRRAKWRPNLPKWGLSVRKKVGVGGKRCPGARVGLHL